jgi:hypothetical protein
MKVEQISVKPVFGGRPKQGLGIGIQAVKLQLILAIASDPQAIAKVATILREVVLH